MADEQSDGGIPFCQSKDHIVSLYLEGMKSIPQISGEVGIPRSAVRSLLLGAGVELRSRADGVRLRSEVLGKHLLGRSRTFSPEHCQAISRGRLAYFEDKSVGYSLKPNGYIEHTRGPHKGRSEHTVIMEQRIGRPLFPDECVHHIDGNRQNNHEDNLALLTRAGHARLHRREEKLLRSESE